MKRSCRVLHIGNTPVSSPTSLQIAPYREFWEKCFAACSMSSPLAGWQAPLQLRWKRLLWIGESFIDRDITLLFVTVCALFRLGQLIGLPEDFLSKGTGGGVIQGTASEAVRHSAALFLARPTHRLPLVSTLSRWLLCLLLAPGSSGSKASPLRPKKRNPPFAAPPLTQAFGPASLRR